MSKFDLVKSALLYPATNDWTGGPYLHGVSETDPTRNKLEFGQYKFGKSLVDNHGRAEFLDKIPEIIEGRWLYLGPASSHFGHFLSECISRYWSIPNIDTCICGSIVLPAKDKTKAMHYVNETISIFGLKPININPVSSFSSVDELLVPEVGKLFGESTKPWFREFLEINNPPEKYYNHVLPKRIIVSRRKYKSAGRVAGFDSICDDLSNSGFFEFQPENYSLRRQLEFICSADDVVWEEGSAIHLLELLPRAPGAHTLIQRRPAGMYDYFSNLMQEKCENMSTWRSVAFIDGLQPPHNRMSRIVGAGEFFDFMRGRTGVTINEQSFLLHEKIDMTYSAALDGINSKDIDSAHKSFQRQISYSAPLRPASVISRVSRQEHCSRTGPSPIKAWCIDSPVKGEEFSTPYSEINISGWIILVDDKYDETIEPYITLHCGERSTRIDINQPRRDVISAIIGTGGLAERQLLCGFRGTAPVGWDKIRICYNFGGFPPILLSTITVRLTHTSLAERNG